MSKHTPGPWHWYGGYDSIGHTQMGTLDDGRKVDFGSSSGLVNSDTGDFVVAGYWCNEGSGCAEPTSPENARLIAAAPEMLEALIVALPWLSEAEAPSLAAKTLAEAAIRKARGEVGQRG